MGEWSGDLGPIPQGAATKAGVLDASVKHLPGRYWRLGFIIEAGCREKVGEVSIGFLVIREDGSQSLN